MKKMIDSKGALKEYIKKVLFESQFDKAPFSENLVSVILDQLMENPNRSIKLYNKIELYLNPGKIDKVVINILGDMPKFIRVLYSAKPLPKYADDKFRRFIINITGPDSIKEIYYTIHNILSSHKFMPKFLNFLDKEGFYHVVYNVFVNNLKQDLGSIYVNLGSSAIRSNIMPEIVIEHRYSTVPRDPEPVGAISLYKLENDKFTVFREYDEIVKEVKDKIDKFIESLT